ncbi:MAG: hypothetical protein M9926_15350 [Lentimicrobium sp.]|uniref:hypothetical protein n=1 Tax=Lentimicrobium sp. TaxID=2034841 RepID=UPI0025DF1829|nr:hypothetical protein [Lentimicrobium sp.]MCO5258123.1 hypothetical protein [Lentimicrobium sp.]HPQ88324.1 hypothetical protein [Gammaproteobacteria bacterium]
MKRFIILYSGVLFAIMLIPGCGRSGIDHYAYELAALHCEIKKVNNELRNTKIAGPEFSQIKEHLKDLRSKQRDLSEEALAKVTDKEDLEKFNTLFNRYVKECEE